MSYACVRYSARHAMHVDLALRAIEGMSEGKRILEDWMGSGPTEPGGAWVGKNGWPTAKEATGRLASRLLRWSCWSAGAQNLGARRPIRTRRRMM